MTASNANSRRAAKPRHSSATREATPWKPSSAPSNRPCSASRSIESREAKAAHLLYFVVKDHPFTDGNKRIGSLLFLLYLKQEGVEHRLNPQALTALTLLIAESAMASKDLMIRLIINLLAEPAA